jgi:radical SAM superfamily enzyme YgiQ (UPF0313 family)
MRVLLISSNTERINMVTIPLGLGLVAAATRRAGHEVTVLDLLDERDPAGAIRRAIEAASPDVIGISVRNIDDQSRDNPRFLLEQVTPVVEACRAGTCAPIVLGGAGYSIFPEAALEYLGADIGVSGDGEVAFLAILDRLQCGGDPADVPGACVAGRRATSGPIFQGDLDAFPLWDEALERLVGAAADPELWVPIQSRRGCPNDCSYCSTARIQGRAIRARSPRLVAGRVALLARAGLQRFYFVDNSFNSPESHALEMCRWLSELAPGVVWRCILYPHRVREELVRAMAEAGCTDVALGFESGSERILREMNKRFTPDDVRATSEMLAAYGIRRMGFVLLGGPGETRETVEETLAFAESLQLDSIKATVGIRIYPGTPLARRAVQDGMISSEDELLLPRFYLAPGLEPWIQERVARLESAGRPPRVRVAGQGARA